MIAAKENERDVVGAITGSTHAMKINDEAMALVMDQLARGLYNRPKEAVIREYSTNARDAHVQAGTQRPLVVRLPTSFKPVLSIQDFGTGLSEQEIGEIYSQYGASTKRESNEFNGMLGFGCKSAFAYSNQFTVVSVKDGTRIEVLVTRSEGGGGEMVVTDPTPSDEPNGTTVQIPTKFGDNFIAEVQKVYRWWPKGSVEVWAGNQRVKINHFDADGADNMNLGDGIVIVKRDRYSDDKDDYVIMGGVGYPHKFDTGLDRYSHGLVVFAPMGAVSFASSREALRLDGHTKRFVAETEAKFKKALVAKLQSKIDAAPTRYEAAKVVADWKVIVPAQVLPASGWLYKGEAIPLSVMRDDLLTAPLRRSGYHNHHRKMRNGLNIDQYVDTLWVDGFTLEKFTSSHAQKLRKYVADNDLESKTSNGFVLVGAIPDELKPWLQTMVDWETIRAVKLPRDVSARQASGLSGRIPGSYDLYTTEPSQLGANQPYISSSGVPAEKFRHWKAPLFYCQSNMAQGHYFWSVIRALHPTATLVCMAAGRINKFCRDFPNATEATVAVKAGYDVWAATPKVKDALLAMAVQRDYTVRRLAEYDASRVDDPELSRYIALSKQDVTAIRDQSRAFANILGVSATLPTVKSPVASYPLMNATHPDHTYFYVNAAYAARQNGATL